MQAALHNPFRILVVEDNKGDVILLQKCFQKSSNPFDMRVVNDGADMFGALLDNESNTAWPDIIILDINMPRVDGLHALGALRQMPAMKGVPVLILTGSRAEHEAEEAKRLGAKGHIVKGVPFALEDIISFVTTAKEHQDLWVHVGAPR
jgi:CheY-like chemotaxis protein